MNEQIEKNSDLPAAPLPESVDAHAPADAEQPHFRPGELVFTAVLFLAGTFFFFHACKLFLRMEAPRVYSAAALPLLTSGTWMVLALLVPLENLRKRKHRRKSEPFGKKARAGVAYAFPKEVVAVLLAIVIYCTLLLARVSFYIVTPLFLYGGMCILMRGGYVKNILYTAIIMAFVVLVFRMVFGVVFP